MDLLYAPVCNSLIDYINHFEQVIRVNKQLNQSSGQLVDCFFMSSRMAGSYFKILAVIAGDDKLRDQDLMFGNGLKADNQSVITPSAYTRKKLYLAKSLHFYAEYISVLPVADTGKARKVSKLLLRCLKCMICAKVEANALERTEQMLFRITTFGEAQSIFLTVFGIEFDLDDKIMQRALDGELIEDWPAWMIAQDAFARKLMEINLGSEVTINESRLYDGVAQVRDLLNKGLKNVLSVDDHTAQLERIDAYVDSGVSAIAKLAIAGVSPLADFQIPGTPEIVSESYDIIIEHLKGKLQGLQVLAAAVVLLEFAFEQTTVTLNAKFEQR